MSTSQYDGESSPIGLLSSLAQMLGLHLINMLALALMLTYLVVTLAIYFHRRSKGFLRATLPILGVAAAGHLSTLPLTERGVNHSMVLWALVCLGTGLGTLVAVAFLRFPQMIGRGDYTPHEWAPMLVGVNLMTAPLWLTLGVTLLQNSASALYVTAIESLHWAMFGGVSLMFLFMLIQAGYTPPSVPDKYLRA